MEKNIGEKRVQNRNKQQSNQTKILLEIVEENVANQINYCEHQKTISDQPDTKRWLSLASTHFENAGHFLSEAIIHGSLKPEKEIISIKKVGNDLILFKALLHNTKNSYLDKLQYVKVPGPYKLFGGDNSDLGMHDYIAIRKKEINDFIDHLTNQIETWTREEAPKNNIE
ncbi:MAG: hypothetical protein ACI8ZM_002488 [Crocinitomix sp.]|jgi:hypothetical protein